MTDPRLPDYLTHILDAAAKIHRYVSGMDAGEFGENDLVQDAVIRNFEIIGEASNRISTRFPRFAVEHPELNLADAYRMRNVVAHEYFGVRLDVVWNTIHDDLPTFAEAVRAALTALGGPEQ